MNIFPFHSLTFNQPFKSCGWFHCVSVQITAQNLGIRTFYLSLTTKQLISTLSFRHKISKSNTINCNVTCSLKKRSNALAILSMSGRGVNGDVGGNEKEVAPSGVRGGNGRMLRPY